MSDRAFEGAVADWLQAGSDRTSPSVIQAVLMAVRTTPQERGFQFPRPFTRVTMPMRFAVLAVTALLAVGAFSLVGGPDPSPTPIPSPGPSSLVATQAPEDPSGWTSFTSDRYGYSMKYPAGWQVSPAQRDWDMNRDLLAWPSEARDSFGPDEAMDVNGFQVFAVGVPPGTSADRWIDAFYGARSGDSACKAAAFADIVISGLPGKLADGPPCGTTTAFLVLSARVYVFTIGPKNPPSLFRAFLSTVQLEPQPGDPIDTGGWTSYRSARYGFEMAYPPGWSVLPADHAWSWERDATNWLSTGQDAFSSPGDVIRVSAWTVPLDAEVDQSWAAHEAWAAEYCARSGNAPCTGLHDRVVPMCIENRDCHPGLIVPFDEDVHYFGHGGVLPEGMTVLAVWRSETSSSVAEYGGSTRLLQGFLSTLGVYVPYYPESIDAAATFLATGE